MFSHSQRNVCIEWGLFSFDVNWWCSRCVKWSNWSFFAMIRQVINVIIFHLYYTRKMFSCYTDVAAATNNGQLLEMIKYYRFCDVNNPNIINWNKRSNKQRTELVKNDILPVLLWLNMEVFFESTTEFTVHRIKNLRTEQKQKHPNSPFIFQLEWQQQQQALRIKMYQNKMNI